MATASFPMWARMPVRPSSICTSMFWAAKSCPSDADYERENLIMADTYTLHVAGLTRELTICKVNDHMDIAAFIMLGDAELTVAAAAELLKKCPEFDILLTAEAKGIPLAHEMSRQSGKPYVCARKGVKLYMPDPVVVEDQSITTAGKQKLVIDRKSWTR